MMKRHVFLISACILLLSGFSSSAQKLATTEFMGGVRSSLSKPPSTGSATAALQQYATNQVSEKLIPEEGRFDMAIGVAQTPSQYQLEKISKATPDKYRLLDKSKLSIGNEAAPIQQTPSRRAGKIRAGQLIARDFNANEERYGAALNLVQNTDDPTKVQVYNLYEWGNDVAVTMNVDEAAGTVAIPQQTLEVNSYYGNIDIVAVAYNSSGGLSIPVDRTIKGTIDENGEVKLGMWAVVAIDEASKQVKATFNIFLNSTWSAPNATLNATTVGDTPTSVAIPMYFEQVAPAEVIVYHMVPGMATTLSARLTPTYKVMLSPQFVTSTSVYGDFYIYGINSSTGKVDASNPIVVSPAMDGSLSFPGYYIADQETHNMVIFGLTGCKITGTYNITFPSGTGVNFKGSGTASDPYQIASYNDLTALSQSVEGGNSYKGKNFTLTADLDLSEVPVTEYVPIGSSASTPFAGTFDGGNHTIKGLRIDGKGFPYIGIFGYLASGSTVKNLVVNGFMAIGSGDEIGCVAGRNEGAIENVTVKNSVLQTEGLLTGGICGASLNGTIKNCFFHGQLFGKGSVAGIAGQASGSEISSCTVKGSFTMNGWIATKARDLGGIAGVLSSGTIKDCLVSGTLMDIYGRSATGGLVGRLLSGGKVYNCLNTASMTGKRLSESTTSYIGGLFGLSASGDVANCQNSGTIVMNGDNKYVGGLTGELSIVYVHSGDKVWMDNMTYFTNCLNTGQIISSSAESNKGLYGYSFHEDNYPELPEDVCLKNCYFDQQVNLYANEKFGRTTKQLLGSLPEGFSTDYWTVTTGHYPVLKLFANDNAAALAQSTIILSDGQDARKVKNSFTVITDPKLVWSLDGTDGKTESESLKMSGNTVTVKDIYDTALVACVSSDGLGMKLYYLAVVPKLFDGEGTAESPYLVKTPTDFEIIHKAVAEHGQQHIGDYFKMANDIDFVEATNFKGVGNGLNYQFGFAGNFDGGNHYIHNFKLEMVNYTDAGDYDSKNNPNGYNALFNYLGKEGSIKNLNIAADCKFDLNVYSAPFVAFNCGLVENCRNYADVKGHLNQIGGIVGVNYMNAKINQCYNAGKIHGGNKYYGGIAGYNYVDAHISNSQNDGEVTGSSTTASTDKTVQTFVGGITSDSYGTVENCVNNGKVSGGEIVGGIIAAINATYIVADPNNPMKALTFPCEGAIRNCINNGQIECRGAVLSRGAIIGAHYSSNEVANNYYDASINLIGGMQANNVEGTKGVSTSELTAGTALIGLSNEVFDFKANNYPVVKAFAKESKSQTLRTMFVNFEPRQLRTNILKTVVLSAPAGIEWTLNVADGFKIENNKLNVSVPTGTSVLSDTLTAKLNGLEKVYLINSVPVIFTGDGTEDSPYLIENKADWHKLSSFVAESKWEYNGYFFRVTNDIDFANDTIMPVAHSGVSFNGVLDGNGKTFKDFVFDNPYGFANKIPEGDKYYYLGKRVGLFGTIGTEGVVKNLTINGIMTGYSEIGGFTGNLYGTIDNCVNKGLVGTISSTGAAGIAYYMYQGSAIRNCVNEGKVLPDNGSGGGQTGAAGIVYTALENTVVENCRNRGEVGSKLKTMNYGIGNSLAGNIINCHNEKPINGTGSLVGLVNTIGKNSVMENCSNTADLSYPEGANVFGVVGTAAAGGSGYMKNCFNTGNITVKNACAGVANTVNMPMIDCYNTGNITSTNQKAVGVVVKLAATTTQRNISSGLYNTGEIKSKYSETAGVASQVTEYAILRDSYNTGNVTQEHNGLCCGGVAAAGYGRLENCFNTGNILSWGHCTGGVYGRPGTSKTDFDAGVYDCFNLGNVEVNSKLTSNSVYAAVGGVAGSPMNGETNIVRCYNTGNVKATDETSKCVSVFAGGISGNVLSYKVVVKDCYNAGRVTAEKGKALVSYTVGGYADRFYLKPDSLPFNYNIKNVYYDASVNKTPAYREVEGSALTTSQLAKAELDGYTTCSHGGYPMLQVFAEEHSAAAISTAMIVLNDETMEHHDNVLCKLQLVAPTSATWEEVGTSKLFSISGDNAYPTKAGSTVLRVTGKDGYYKEFSVKVGDSFTSSVEDLGVSKTIESETYIDVAGKIVLTMQPGEVYIVRTKYTDGTMTVTKRIAK